MTYRNTLGQFRRAQPEDLTREHGASLAEFLKAQRQPPPAWLVTPSPSGSDDPAERALARDLRDLRFR